MATCIDSQILAHNITALSQSAPICLTDSFLIPHSSDCYYLCILLDCNHYFALLNLYLILLFVLLCLISHV